MQRKEYAWLLVTLTSAVIAAYKLVRDYFVRDNTLEIAYFLAGVVLAINAAIYVALMIYKANKVTSKRK